MTDFQNSVVNPSPEANARASTFSPAPSAIYDGGFSSAKETGVLLRIGNGGAGQIGLIGALANAFIQDWAAKGYSPCEVSSE